MFCIEKFVWIFDRVGYENTFMKAFVRDLINNKGLIWSEGIVLMCLRNNYIQDTYACLHTRLLRLVFSLPLETEAHSYKEEVLLFCCFASCRIIRVLVYGWIYLFINCLLVCVQQTYSTKKTIHKASWLPTHVLIFSIVRVLYAIYTYKSSMQPRECSSPRP